MFSKTERRAIQEKVDQLGKVKSGIWSVQYLADLITERRVAWIKERKDELLAKYAGLPLEELAWKVVCFDHMGINLEYSRMTRVSDRKIRIDSYNFCPYLEACLQIGLDTVRICKEIGEPAIQKMIEVLDPRLKFSRNYNNIRPYSVYCEEYFEVL